jgi:hypothetical protein
MAVISIKLILDTDFLINICIHSASMKNFSLWGTLDMMIRLNQSLVITDMPMDMHMVALEVC